MSYIGRGIDQIDNISTLDNLTFNGSDATFNLTQNSVAFVPVSADALQIQIDGIIQSGNYTVSGSTVTFDFTPSGSSVCNGIRHFGVGIITSVSDGAVTTAKLGNNSVGITQLNVSDGTNGQALTTNGSGTLAFSSVSADADNYFATSGLSSKDLGVGLHIKTADSGSTVASGADELVVEGSGDTGLSILSGTDANGSIMFGDSADNDGGRIQYNPNNDRMMFTTNGSERMRLDSSGNLLHAKTTNNSNNVGIELRPAGELTITRTNNQLLDINRTDNDGTLVTFRQANTTEGIISVSGGTVTYISFAGSHWSRLADNSKPTILRGTILESISTLIDWYQVEYTKDEKTLTEYIGALPDGKSVGDSHTVTVNGVEYTGTISKEDNERLPKCKISDTEDSKAVYGVFMDWDNDDDNVNDMYVAALGAFVVRIHKDETVAIGDYLQSKGDGTAKKQADDILRASTIAKVTSTEKTHEYADGSYCVPCTLHCG
jgi:hypothetical protein